MTKFCRDCKHAELTLSLITLKPVLARKPQCLHPNAAMGPTGPNLVTGRVEEAEYYLCSVMRAVIRPRSGGCGPEGKWFEAAK